MMPATRMPWCATFLVALASGAGAAPPAEGPGPASPQAWLERMGDALERVNYQGTLVELDGDGATVMRVVHRYADGLATERLTALDGVGREIIRQGDEVMFILPDQRTVLVDRRENVPGSTSRLREQFSAPLSLPVAHYRLATEAGPGLVGRATQLVVIDPADNLRYGYRLWLDQATAIPLRVQVTGEEGEIVEQVMFADISLDEAIDDAAVRPSRSTEGFTRRRAATPPSAAPDLPAPAPWAADRLPAGFTLQATVAKPGRDGARPLTQFVYTDGVATVSVFVEAVPPGSWQAGGSGSAPGGGGDAPSGSHVGGANVYTLVNGGHLVTAMGEVPAATVRMIAEAMRPAAANARAR
jgi:sigma-E factor negative regulatory protein RseB